jgi:hypothetical protein
MLLNSILAVAIGLLILWIVLSFATIQIQEWISTRFGKRARVVEDAIHEMLANPNLKAQFYDHPIIHNLTAKKIRTLSGRSPWFQRYSIVRDFIREERTLPSYIPSEQFALALLDILMTTGTESSLILQGILKVRDDLTKEENISSHETVIVELNLLAELARSAAGTEAGTVITRITPEKLKEEVHRFATRYPEFRNVMENLLEEATRLKLDMEEVLDQQSSQATNGPLANLRRGVAALSVISPELNQILNALILNAEIDESYQERKLYAVKQKIENWFDNSMDRVSGAYKRYSKALAFIIGIYLAVLLNIDMNGLTIYLWREAFVRQVLMQNVSNVAVAQQVPGADLNPTVLDSGGELLIPSVPPIGWTIHRSEVKAFFDDKCQLFPGDGQAFGVPLFSSTICISPPNSTDKTNIFLKLFGFFITALAAQLGAPFWFDVMKRWLRQP